MANETPPFTLSGWMLGRAADQAEIVCIYLQKLKHAKSMQERMLIHGDFMKMQLEKVSGRAKTINDYLVMTDTLVGSIIQLLRHKERLDESMQSNSARVNVKPTTDNIINLEQRLRAIEQRLTEEKFLK